MAEISSLSTTDASNTTRFSEGQTFSSVNDGMRAVEGYLARFYKDIFGGLASTGSSNAYALAINRTDFDLTAAFDGYILGFIANHASTGAATLNVTPSGGSAKGAVPMRKFHDIAIASGDIEAGMFLLVQYEYVDGTTTNDRFQVLTQLASAPITASDTATTSAAGVIEIATSAETTTGTDATRAVSPDGLAGSAYGTAVVPILVFNDATDCSTGDGAGDIFFRVPSILNGWDLVGVAACVQTAGTTGTMSIQIHNVTDTADMLSTALTIDTGETDTATAATPAAINTSADDVATGDQIRIDVDAVHTTPAKGLLVELQFRLP